MYNSTRGKQLRRNTYYLMGLLPIFLLFGNSSYAQRAYTRVYSQNLKGGTITFGNTLLNIVKTDRRGNITGVDLTKMNSLDNNGNSSYGNDNQDMQFVDIDGNTGIGTATRNSSSSDLVLPAGTNTIKFARLYWGGKVKNTDYNLTTAANRTIKMKFSTAAAYTDFTASNLDGIILKSGSGRNEVDYTQYQASADITDYVKSFGAGSYIVGNAPLSVGSSIKGGAYGGWAIVVVYENTSLPYNSVRVYDGFQEVFNGGDSTASTITLTGLNVPSGAMSSADARMGVVTWEGDANITGDNLKINGNTFSNALNPANNNWNSSITDNGVNVTTKNPNYTNQMGIDIDMFNVGTGYGIKPSDQNVTLEFGTVGDRYFPGVFSFAIKMKDPSITINKTVAAVNGNNVAAPGDVLTYTLTGQNIGVGNANYIEVRDTLPDNVSYKPGTLMVISSPGFSSNQSLSDAAGDDQGEYIVNGSDKVVVFRIGTGASSSQGGVLASGEQYTVQFQTTVNVPLPGTSGMITNIGHVTSQSDAQVNFVDESSASIQGPEAGPMPVTLSRFTASLINSNSVELNWTTSQEINNSRFVVERSTDANNFIAVGTVAGNGTSYILHNYSLTDDISSVDANVIYYRLRQIDLDGKSNLSNVVAVKIPKNAAHRITVSPNPFSSYININTDWDQSEEGTATILNVQGKVLMTKTVHLYKGNNQIRIDNLSVLPSGNYFIQLSSPNGKVVQKIIK